jgi:hypothetical protein
MFLVIFFRVARCLFVGVHDSHDTDIVRCDQLKNKSSRRVTYGNPCYTLARYRFLATAAPPRGGSAQLSVDVFKIPPLLICNITH